MDNLMYDLRDMILCDVEEQIKKGKISPSEYSVLGEAIDIIKDIETIEAMRHYDYEDSEVSGAMSGGRMYPMGRYGYSGNSYDMPKSTWDASFERGRSPRTGRYVSRDDEIMSKLNHMMSTATTEQERATIQKK